MCVWQACSRHDPCVHLCYLLFTCTRIWFICTSEFECCTVCKFQWIQLTFLFPLDLWDLDFGAKRRSKSLAALELKEKLVNNCSWTHREKRCTRVEVVQQLLLNTHRKKDALGLKLVNNYSWMHTEKKRKKREKRFATVEVGQQLLLNTHRKKDSLGLKLANQFRKERVARAEVGQQLLDTHRKKDSLGLKLVNNCSWIHTQKWFTRTEVVQWLLLNTHTHTHTQMIH